MRRHTSVRRFLRTRYACSPKPPTCCERGSVGIQASLQYHMHQPAQLMGPHLDLCPEPVQSLVRTCLLAPGRAQNAIQHVALLLWCTRCVCCLHRRAAHLRTRRYRRPHICARHRPAPRRRCVSRRRPGSPPRAGMGRPSRRPLLLRRPRPGSCQGLGRSRPSWASRDSSEEHLSQTSQSGIKSRTAQQLRVSPRGQVGTSYPCMGTTKHQRPSRLMQSSPKLAEEVQFGLVKLSVVMLCRCRARCS